MHEHWELPLELTYLSQGWQMEAEEPTMLVMVTMKQEPSREHPNLLVHICVDVLGLVI